MPSKANDLISNQKCVEKTSQLDREWKSIKNKYEPLDKLRLVRVVLSGGFSNKNDMIEIVLKAYSENLKKFNITPPIFYITCATETADGDSLIYASVLKYTERFWVSDNYINDIKKMETSRVPKFLGKLVVVEAQQAIAKLYDSLWADITQRERKSFAKRERLFKKLMVLACEVMVLDSEIGALSQLGQLIEGKKPEVFNKRENKKIIRKSDCPDLPIEIYKDFIDSKGKSTYREHTEFKIEFKKYIENISYLRSKLTSAISKKSLLLSPMVAVTLYRHRATDYKNRFEELERAVQFLKTREG
tara:strand:+ start:6807 stop:7715 length:909 start_codon:yes stop_codon:yes gene_type:complete